ncbi:hypothetical protein BaRGS_00015820 [Batillaria attramentaria]|uniref:Glutathione peroxidase n=1 Tax=Batillaria attramentaria TaxID=370345 RepID=A0ABD0L0X7_9CAEN
MILWPILLLLVGTAADDKLGFYAFSVRDIHGDIVSLDKYKGKVSLVVNVASFCGYTDDHYEKLAKLQDILGPTGKFNVLAFPCNQFGQQEPGSSEAILKFAQRKKANFPIFEKVDVTGPNSSDAWSFLINSSQTKPNWNFWKYLVDHEGHIVEVWAPWDDLFEQYDTIKGVVDKAVAADGGKDRGGEL